jgi:hypothetical protein
MAAVWPVNAMARLSAGRPSWGLVKTTRAPAVRLPRAGPALYRWDGGAPGHRRFHAFGAHRQELPLSRIAHVVLGGQARVGVLGREMDTVVVAPESPGRLEVGVVVVLEKPGVGDAAGVSVILRQRSRSVQVDRGCQHMAIVGLVVWTRSLPWLLSNDRSEHAGRFVGKNPSK